MPRVRDKLSYANVMATIAVFVAMGGGAYAASLPKNSVGSAQLKNRQVKSVDIGSGAVNFRHVGVDVVDGLKVIDDSLTGEDIDESTLVCSEIPGATCTQ